MSVQDRRMSRELNDFIKENKRRIKQAKTNLLKAQETRSRSLLNEGQRNNCSSNNRRMKCRNNSITTSHSALSGCWLDQVYKNHQAFFNPQKSAEKPKRHSNSRQTDRKSTRSPTRRKGKSPTRGNRNRSSRALGRGSKNNSAVGKNSNRVRRRTPSQENTCCTCPTSKPNAAEQPLSTPASFSYRKLSRIRHPPDNGEVLGQYDAVNANQVKRMIEDALWDRCGYGVDVNTKHSYTHKTGENNELDSGVEDDSNQEIEGQYSSRKVRFAAAQMKKSRETKSTESNAEANGVAADKEKPELDATDQKRPEEPSKENISEQVQGDEMATLFDIYADSRYTRQMEQTLMKFCESGPRGCLLNRAQTRGWLDKWRLNQPQLHRLYAEVANKKAGDKAENNGTSLGGVSRILRELEQGRQEATGGGAPSERAGDTTCSTTGEQENYQPGQTRKRRRRLRKKRRRTKRSQRHRGSPQGRNKSTIRKPRQSVESSETREYKLSSSMSRQVVESQPQDAAFQQCDQESESVVDSEEDTAAAGGDTGRKPKPVGGKHGLKFVQDKRTNSDLSDIWPGEKQQQPNAEKDVRIGGSQTQEALSELSDIEQQTTQPVTVMDLRPKRRRRKKRHIKRSSSRQNPMSRKSSTTATQQQQFYNNKNSIIGPCPTHTSTPNRQRRVRSKQTAKNTTTKNSTISSAPVTQLRCILGRALANVVKWMGRNIIEFGGIRVNDTLSDDDDSVKAVANAGLKPCRRKRRRRRRTVKQTSVTNANTAT